MNKNRLSPKHSRLGLSLVWPSVVQPISCTLALGCLLACDYTFMYNILALCYWDIRVLLRVFGCNGGPISFENT